MMPIQFEKDFAESVLSAIKNGESITTPDGKWSVSRMLSLAGMLHAAVVSHGPIGDKVAGITPEMRAAMDSEKREAVEDTFYTEISDAIDFHSMLTSQVMDGEFDERYEPEVKAVVFRGPDGKKVGRRLAGFKDKGGHAT
jgi:hypothetical protein